MCVDGPPYLNEGICEDAEVIGHTAAFGARGHFTVSFIWNCSYRTVAILMSGFEPATSCA